MAVNIGLLGLLVLVGMVVVFGLLIKHRQWWVLGGLGVVGFLFVATMLFTVRMSESRTGRVVSGVEMVDGQHGLDPAAGMPLRQEGLLGVSTSVQPTVLLLIVIMMVGVVVGLGVVVKNKGWGMGLVLAGVGLLPFVAVMGVGVGLLSKQGPSVRRGGVSPEPVFTVERVGGSPSVVSTGGAWLGSVDTTFEADLYASPEAAGGALGRQVVIEMREGGVDWGLPKRTLVIGGEVSESVLRGVVNSIEKLLSEQMHAEGHDVGVALEDDFLWVGVVPGAEGAGVQQIVNITRMHKGHGIDLAPGKQDVRQEDWDVVVRLKIEEEQEADEFEDIVVDEGSAEAVMRLEAQISKGLDATVAGRVVSVDFVNKPWVGAFDAYASLHPERSMVLARSGDLATSAEEAHRAAVEHGARELARRVGGKVDEIGISMARQGIESSEFVTDRFVQKLSRPYGDVWREAMLVETDLEALAKRVAKADAQHVRETHTQVVHERKTWAGMAGGVLGVIVLVGGMYLVLSYATRGYYDWWLRLAVVVFGGAGVLVIVAVLGGGWF